MLHRSIHFSLVSGLLLVSAFLVASTAFAQTETSLYFSERGHTVRGPFYEFFVATGGVERYGYPITDDYVDSGGQLVQYFQKARMEWHPGNPDPYKVQLGLLGQELGKSAPPLLVTQIPSRNDPDCTYFPETGHTLCHKFRDYWRDKGGLDMFGYPIAEYTIENGLIVQYFQRARMEWHPEKPKGQEIVLAPLGEIYYTFAKLDPNRLEPTVISPFFQVTSINMRGSVLSAVAHSGGRQTGYIYVFDQLGNPISEASVTLLVSYPTGKQSFTLPPTGKNGTTFLSFDVGQVKPGKVVDMEFFVAFDGIFTSTRTSYLVWFN